MDHSMWAKLFQVNNSSSLVWFRNVAFCNRSMLICAACDIFSPQSCQRVEFRDESVVGAQVRPVILTALDHRFGSGSRRGADRVPGSVCIWHLSFPSSTAEGYLAARKRRVINFNLKKGVGGLLVWTPCVCVPPPAPLLPICPQVDGIPFWSQGTAWQLR